jgi:predicted nucleic acid-binding protein
VYIPSVWWYDLHINQTENQMNFLEDVVSSVRKAPRREKYAHQSIIAELAMADEEKQYLAQQEEQDMQEMMESQYIIDALEEEEERREQEEADERYRDDLMDSFFDWDDQRYEFESDPMYY